MAVPGIKYDDGTGGFATNCFPVRGLIQENGDDGSGAWLVAHKAEQRRRFKAVVCAKPRTYSQIREERKRALKEGGKMVPPAPPAEEDDEKLLDGFFLMKHCCVEDPVDLCSVNVSGQELTDVKAEDFCLFDNVAYVNVSENVLPFQPLKNFPIIRELEMSLNCLRNIKVNIGDFPHLETLDLSYNNLAPEDLLPLGLIPNLRVLSITGNYLKTLPPNLTKPYMMPDSLEEVPRFPALEILMVDDNKFSDVSAFASLAGLRRLRHLNLSRNEIFVVPQLLLIDGRHVTQESDSMKKSIGKLRSGRRSSRSAKRQKSSQSANGRKSILKNTPSLEGPTNTPLLKRPPSGPPNKTESSPTQGVDDSPNHSVTFKEAQHEDGTELSTTLDTGLEMVPLPDMNGAGSESAEPKPVTDELEFGELNLEQLDEQIAEETFQEAVAEHRAKSLSGVASPTPPPFPELRSLDLSHNQISDEDSLLAVAAWPMLAEMSIHDNPLTTYNSGDPPLLKRYLTERLGIKIIRKRPEGPIKPKVEVQLKAERMVNTVIPPVPRCNVEELLAIEAPRREPQSGRSTGASVRSSRRSSRQSPRSMERSTPLPPIPTTPRHETEEETEGKPEETDADAFFMTQVEDQRANEQQQKMQSEPAMVPQPPKTSKTRSRRATSMQKKVGAALEQYKELEELLNIPSDEEDGEDVGQDLSSNVKSLQYMLKHPLLFRDKPLPMDQPQPPFRPLTKFTPKSCPPRKTKEEEVDEVLVMMRERSTVMETNLGEVIKHPDHPQEQDFPDAPRLLTEIQNRYNIVRATSLREASDVVLNAQEIMEDAMRKVDRIASNTPQRAKKVTGIC